MAQAKTLLGLANIDKPLLFVYLLMVMMGWFNIYAAVYNDLHHSIFDLNMQYGKQLLWIIAALVIAASILLIDSKFFSVFTYPIYGFTVFLLVMVLFFGREVNGARAWFEFGGIRLQPGELAKVATSLAISKILSRFNVNVNSWKTILLVGGILAVPGAIILLQNDTGSMIVYVAFSLVLYRMGMPGSILLLGVACVVLFIVSLIFPPYYIVLGILAVVLISVFFVRRRLKDLTTTLIVLASSLSIAFIISRWFISFTWMNFTIVSLCTSAVPFLLIAYRYRLKFVFVLYFLLATSISLVFSVDYLFNSVLEKHQRTRINVLLGNESDLKGAEYNVNQSKIAIGSGGFSGKGYLQGTQTKFNFVPEQSTDFIFCTVGEEWGFIGSVIVIGLFVFLLVRIIIVAEKQRSVYSKLFGYCVASIFFFHFAINVGMTFGMVPVIGIPLPFFSYGGSSLWSFTILLFIFLKLDLDRDKIVM
jgi:rod shape determining protein RodA